MTQKKKKTKEDIGEGPARCLLGLDRIVSVPWNLAAVTQFEKKKKEAKKAKRYDNIMSLEVNYDDVPARNRMGTIPSQFAVVAEALGSV